MMSALQSFFNFFLPAYDKNQLKVQLKTAMIRLKIHRNKRVETGKQLKVTVLHLMREGKDEVARIRVEQLLRDQEVGEACELVLLFCETLLIRVDLLDLTTTIPHELVECLHTLLWASVLLGEVSELGQVREQLGLKYGKEVVQGICVEGTPYINPQVKHKLTVKQQPAGLVHKMLEDICGPLALPPQQDHHHHPFPPPPPGPSGGTQDSVLMGGASPFPPPAPFAQSPSFPSPPPFVHPSPNFGNYSTPETPNSPFPLPPTHQSSQPSVPFGDPPMSSQPPIHYGDPPSFSSPPITDQRASFPVVTEDSSLDLDDLTARFEALKQKTQKHL